MRSGPGIPEDPKDLGLDLVLAPVGVEAAQEGRLVSSQGPVHLAGGPVASFGGQPAECFQLIR